MNYKEYICDVIKGHDELTVIVGLADDVLLPVLVHVVAGAVAHPRRDGELRVRKLSGAEMIEKIH